MNPNLAASVAWIVFLSSIVSAAEPAGKIIIQSFMDSNGNGVWDDGEEGLPGSRYAIKGGSYATSLVTDGSGSAWTWVPEGGSYLVLEEVPEEWSSTTPNPVTLTVDGGSEIYVRFGRADQVAAPEVEVTTSTSTSVMPSTSEPPQTAPPLISGDAVRAQPTEESSSLGNIPPLMAIISFFAYVIIKRF